MWEKGLTITWTSGWLGACALSGLLAVDLCDLEKGFPLPTYSLTLSSACITPRQRWMAQLYKPLHTRPEHRVRPLILLRLCTRDRKPAGWAWRNIHSRRGREGGLPTDLWRKCYAKVGEDNRKHSHLTFTNYCSKLHLWGICGEIA